MARRPKLPSTPALRLLRQLGLPHEPTPYDYVPRGGTSASAAALGVDEHVVIKTLIFQDADAKPLIVLMHGDREVSAKSLARAIGSKLAEPCKPEVAERHSGYKVGGTSPFGTRSAMPVYVEASVLTLEAVYVNAGARGVLMRVSPQLFVDVLDATPVQVARD